MPNVACDEGLTLAPFHGFYDSNFDAALLSDSFFRTVGRQLADQPEMLRAEPAPKVIQMPDRLVFDRLVVRWMSDSEFDSLPDEMTRHASFKKIVQEGSRAVPLIASSLRRTPSFLFLALEEIFGEDHVPAEAYGDLQATATAWLKWLQR